MKPPKPSTFDPVGSDPEALESWLDQMDSYFVLAETAETDKNEKVLTASFYLAGKARDWYRTEKAKLTSWAEFKKRMKSYFIPSNYRIVLVQQWDKLAWQKGQTAAQYSNEIKSLALKLDKSDEDKIHKLVFNGNPRFITQLVTQMGIADQAVATDATADKYDIIEKIALNLEQAIAIADAARPQRQFVPRNSQSVSTASNTLHRTPRTTMTTESNWRSSTPNRSTKSSSTRVPDPVPYIPDPIPYGLSEAKYLRLREAKACFYCEKENVDPSHNYRSCPKRQANLERKMKQEEMNFVDESKIMEADNYQYEPSDSYSVPITTASPSSSSVPPIIVSATLDNHAVRGPADSGASSNFVSPQVVQQAKLRMRPTTPSLLRQALSKTPVYISKQITASVKLADGIQIKEPSTFKVAPLASHEVIFGMPFLAENNLLIDPVARKLLPRPICDLNKYVKVGNALMELPAPDIPIEEVNSIIEEPPEYKSLNDFFMKEFPEVFISKRTGRLPPKGGPMHRIILKDEKKPINGRLIRVPAKYYLPMRRFIMENVRCGRLRLSTSHISSGTLMIPRKDLSLVSDEPKIFKLARWSERAWYYLLGSTSDEQKNVPARLGSLCSLVRFYRNN